jgi:hypothetical protein
MTFEHLALAAVRDVLGEPVTYDPDGVAVAVKAVVRRPDVDLDAFGMALTAPTVTLEIVASDLVAPDIEIAAGDVIEMASGERRLVKAVPRYLDSQRLVLLVDTVSEDI